MFARRRRRLTASGDSAAARRSREKHGICIVTYLHGRSNQYNSPTSVAGDFEAPFSPFVTHVIKLLLVIPTLALLIIVAA